MTVCKLPGKTGRGLAVAAAVLATIGLTTVPRPAAAGGGWIGGGIGPGAAVGIGLGAFALGSVLANPYYYNQYYYPYTYYPSAPAYYSPYYPPPAPAYSPPPGYPPPSYPPQAGRSGGNIARQLNQQELNSLQAAPSPYFSPPRY